MDLFPLYNSLRIAFISTAITFFLGIFSAYYIAKAPKILKGILDCILTLPMVLPPTVVGFFLLLIISPNGIIGKYIFQWYNLRITMTWYAAIFSTSIVAFPLMYRTARGAFESFDKTLLYAGKTLGLSNAYIFWRVMIPTCKQGILAGVVLAFTRCLGEYGATSMVAGYTPNRTATISTTVYQLWRESNDILAYKWVLINLLISLVVLLSVNLLEKNQKMEN